MNNEFIYVEYTTDNKGIEIVNLRCPDCKGKIVTFLAEDFKKGANLDWDIALYKGMNCPHCGSNNYRNAHTFLLFPKQEV